jgi:hypothetical protein
VELRSAPGRGTRVVVFWPGPEAAAVAGPTAQPAAAGYSALPALAG